jgi:hypothetical protein
LIDIYGYRILEMPRKRDRSLCAFTRRGSRMTYSVATVVRLAAPERSWLAAEMKDERATASKRKSGAK